jgi:hypothetical protein
MEKVSSRVYCGGRNDMPFATGKRRTRIKVLSIVILVFLGLLDYATGYEFGFFIFYFIPVSIAAWYGGRTPGLAMAFASAACWYLADRMTHHPYPKPYFAYWETFARLVSFITTALTLSKIRETVHDVQRLEEELSRAQEETRELKRRLQSGPSPGETREDLPLP